MFIVQLIILVMWRGAHCKLFVAQQPLDQDQNENIVEITKRMEEQNPEAKTGDREDVERDIEDNHEYNDAKSTKLNQNLGKQFYHHHTSLRFKAANKYFKRAHIFSLEMIS